MTNQEDMTALISAVKELWSLGRTPTEIDKDTLTRKTPTAVGPVDFAKDIIDAAKLDGLTFFHGFLGGSQTIKEAAHVRVYASLEFAEYLDIPKDDIVRIVDLQTPFNSLAGQALWVKESAKLVSGQTGVSSVQLQTRLLSGDISSASGGWSSPGEPDRGTWSYPFRCGQWSYPFRCQT